MGKGQRTAGSVPSESEWMPFISSYDKKAVIGRSEHRGRGQGNCGVFKKKKGNLIFLRNTRAIFMGKVLLSSWDIKRGLWKKNFYVGN